MLCSQCGKNPAALLAKAIVHNKLTEIPLCAPCAQSHGFDVDAEQPPFAPSALPRRSGQLRCEACGLRYRAFKASGLLGCPECWDAFEVPLEAALTRIHGAARHRGKTYEAPLRHRLEAAIREERFEDASILKGLMEDEG